MAIRAVIDTNVLVAALSSKSVYHWLITSLFDEKFELCITDAICLEYEEILRAKYSESVTIHFLIALRELPNVLFAHVYYNWNLIRNDPDDDKFVDCYVASGAHYLITHDSHFSVLQKVIFPQVNVVRIQDFETALCSSQ